MGGECFGGIVRKCSIVEYVSMVEIFRGGLGWIFYFWGGLGLVKKNCFSG